MLKQIGILFLLFSVPPQILAQLQTPIPPQFSQSGGFYQTPAHISLTADDQTSIYYSTNGAVPDENSFQYSGPISLNETGALRAVAIGSDGTSSEVVTQTYFIQEPINLPVVSLVTDPAHLFSDESGIYVTGTNGIRGSCDPVIRNLNQDWERPVNIELYEMNGQPGLNQQAGIQIFGGCSRTRFPQKSFSLFARSEYGKGSFDYQLFPDKEIYEFESFLLRSSADDQVRTMFQDAFTAYALRDNMELDYMAYRPVAVFINGQYWGIHNIREKVNEHYFEGNFNVDPDEVNVLERNARISHGDSSQYTKLTDFLSASDMANTANYETISKLIDINQFIDYEIANIHLAEVDWPGNNIKFWSAPNSAYNKWRWILFDRDQTFQLYRANTNALALATADDGPSWPNPPWSTLLLRKLLENPDFRNRFIQTYAWHLSTTFDTLRVSHVLDDFKARIANEIPRHIARWGGQLDPDKSEEWPQPTFNSVEEWESNVENVRSFLPKREPFAIEHLQEYFSIGERSAITIETNGASGGVVKLFDKVLPELSTASYFDEVELKLTAIANDGFLFSHWEVENQTISSEELIIAPTETSNIVAHFVENPDGNLPLVINEINYHSADGRNSGDWVELYNPNDYKLNISGWKLQDDSEENLFTFLENTTIDGKGYLVVCESLTDFDVLFPKVTNRLGGLGFKFSNGGEVVKLFTREGILVDSVRYDDESPWPTEADGEGSTLELIDPEYDNNLAASWRASVAKGSPGKFNDGNILLAVDPAAISGQKFGFSLHQNYPNPTVNGLTTLSYEISKGGKVVIKLFDVEGREVDTIVDANQQPNNYELAYRIDQLNEGVYFVMMQFDNTYVQVNRMMVKR
ncbi:MAG: CotH kinase family protein [Imperialibacter sp.]|uniref:CotH kinase family protein n=1 Tax=Imperialibacter sp. TaxID=2038411 RepID=UPI0032EDB906